MEKSDLERKVSFLKEVAPFNNLPKTTLAQVATSFVVRKYKNRAMIIHEGDTSFDFYVIKSGKVRVLTTNEMGDESCLRVLASKDILGELSAYDCAPRSASVQAIGPCVMLAMSHNDFMGYLKDVPNLALAFIHFLSEKLRWTTHFSHTLAQHDTAGRLIHMLIHYKEKFGKEIAAGKIYEIDLSLNQTDLASMVGARREWINRLLQQWRKNGYITYSSGKITILDLPALISEKDSGMAQLQEETW